MHILVHDSLEAVNLQEFLKEHGHERAEGEFLQSIARKGMNAIDVGANVGIAAVAIANSIGKTGVVHCFEPVREYFGTVRNGYPPAGLQAAAVTG